MGVKGLWELLHPVARPIKLEALANKRLAIDASIWLHQFMRGMRDNDGAMVSNAHIIGFFRRICKLLYYNIKPVFVFDGGTPILKRLTIVSFFLYKAFKYCFILNYGRGASGKTKKQKHDLSTEYCALLLSPHHAPFYIE